MKRCAITLAAAIAGCAPAKAEQGVASVYGNGDGFAGRCVAEWSPRTGCQPMDPAAMAAAHRTLPFGTIVRVVNLRNGREVRVRINDRGPFIRGRVIDLTPAAAAVLRLGGLGPVRLERVAER